ncbi:MAG: hypothetical protein QGI60_00870 [archaeon]|jgi:hypothetical protein|nr:hypothetical protein [archaeon]
MSIYDGNSFSMPSVNISLKQLKVPLMALIGIIIVIAIVFSISEFLKPKPLSLSISPNPLDLTDFSWSTALLETKVVNTFNETVSDVVVKVEEVGSSQLFIFPASRRIESMAPGTKQELKPFVVRTDPNKQINSGSYKLRVSLSIGGEEKHSEELILEIKAV